MDWVRKHSPLKSRNKPLPNTPANDSPLRSPIKPISANISPPKPLSKTHKQAALKPKTRDKATSSPAKNKDSVTSYESNQFIAQVQDQPKKTVRLRRSSRDKSSTEVSNLTKRVSSLEAQLEEAKRELRNVVGSSKAGFRVSSANIPRTSHVDQSARERRIRSADYTEKHEPGKGRTDIRSHSVTPPSNQQKKYSGADKIEHQSFSNDERRTDLQHKRKRSELRQATWEHIQSHILDIQQQAPRSKKSKHSCEQKRPHYDKQLPPSPVNKYDGHDQIKVGKDRQNEDSGDVLARQAINSKSGTSRNVNFEQATANESPAMAAQAVSPAVQSQPPEAISYPHIDDVFSPQEHKHTKKVQQNDISTSAFYISRPPSPCRRHVPSPSRLDPVNEEFEWDDDEIF